MPTFVDVLTAEVRREPGRPLLTWYDETTGERVELSVTTYANWVAKTASLLVEEHDLTRGDVLLVDLRAHWLGPVVLGGAWLAGLVVSFPGTEREPDAVVCGPEGLATWTPRAGVLPVLACSLLPMGVRFAEPLPSGVHDVGVEIWSQPDAFLAYDPPTAADPALDLGGAVRTQDELFTTGPGSPAAERGPRVLTAANPASPPGFAAFVRPLCSSGSLVLVRGADATRLDAIAAAELVGARLP